MTRGIDGRVKEKESQRGFAAAHRSEFWPIGMLGTTVKFLIQKNWLNFMNPFIWRLLPALHQGLQKMPMLKVVRCLRQNGCDRRCDILSIKPLYMHALDPACCTFYYIAFFYANFGNTIPVPYIEQVGSFGQSQNVTGRIMATTANRDNCCFKHIAG